MSVSKSVIVSEFAKFLLVVGRWQSFRVRGLCLQVTSPSSNSVTIYFALFPQLVEHEGALEKYYCNVYELCVHGHALCEPFRQRIP